MKLIGIIGLILLTSVILISWGGILDDFEENYIDTGISQADPVNSTFREDYDERSQQINETYSPLKEDIDDLGKQEGFLDVLGDNAVVLPKLIISLPGMILTTFTNTAGDVSTVLQQIGIPNELVLIAIVMLSIISIFKIVELIRRYNA